MSGCDEGTPANSSSMVSLKTCRVHAIVWIKYVDCGTAVAGFEKIFQWPGILFIYRY